MELLEELSARLVEGELRVNRQLKDKGLGVLDHHFGLGNHMESSIS